MSRVEELSEEMDGKLKINNGNSDSPAGPPEAPDIIEQLLEQAVPFPSKPGQSSSNPTGPAMPPAMENVRQYTADEVVSMLNRTPLFMTTLDETDGEGGENIELAALRALAYEGTRAEIAGNFREQGNDQARAKRWKDAKEFYDQALAALKAPQQKDPDETARHEVKEIDEVAEGKKEREIEEACHVNRALCNLELSKTLQQPQRSMRPKRTDL
jgi:hypothetical protein